MANKWNGGKFTVSRILYEMDEKIRNYYMINTQQAEEAAKAAAEYLQNITIRGSKNEYSRGNSQAARCHWTSSFI